LDKEIGRLEASTAALDAKKITKKYSDWKKKDDLHQLDIQIENLRAKKITQEYLQIEETNNQFSSLYENLESPRPGKFSFR